MEVDFEFALNGNRYRVLRKRALKKAGAGVRGVPELQFQVLDDAAYRAITGDTVSETERKIRETLGLDYETFVNSSMVLQGKADSFTTKTPAERKRVLGELLDLGRYDRLEELAREHARELEAEAGQLRAAIEEIEREAAKRPEYEAERHRAGGEVEALDAEARVKDAELRVAQAELRTLETQKGQLELVASDADEARERGCELVRESRLRHKKVKLQCGDESWRGNRSCCFPDFMVKSVAG